MLEQGARALRRWAQPAVYDWAGHPTTWACVLMSLLLGHTAASVAAWALVVALPYYHASRRHARLRRRQLLGAVLRAAQSGDTLAQLGPLLPAWLNLEASEPAEFLNTALQQLWPHVKSAVERALLSHLQPLLAALPPLVVGGLAIDTLDLGHEPPVVAGVRAHRARAHVALDLRVQFTGDSNVIVRAGKLPVKLNNLAVYGTLRLALLALDAGALPGFRAVAVAFTRSPRVTFALAAVHVPVPQSLAAAVPPLLADAIARVAVWPRRVVVPLAPLAPAALAALLRAGRGGDGALRARVLEVRVPPPAAHPDDDRQRRHHGNAGGCRVAFVVVLITQPSVCTDARGAAARGVAIKLTRRPTPPARRFTQT
jgi:hypothetical protein